MRSCSQELEEGTLPIRQAADDEDALAEERRLLYVGLTRARRHLVLSWAERRAGPGDREVSPRPSRFLGSIDAGAGHDRSGTMQAAGAMQSSRAHCASRVTVLAGCTDRSGPAERPTDQPALAASSGRGARPGCRADGVPPYVVAPDALLAALVEQRPATIAGLRRVKGMGPARLDRYGDEILAILARH